MLKPSILTLFAVMLIASPLLAQQEAAPKKKGKNKGSAAGFYVIKQLDAAELTEDQKKQIRTMGKEVDKAMQDIRKATGITPQLVKDRQAKIKELADSIKNYRKRVAEAEKVMGLPPEQVEGFEKLNQLRKKLMEDAKELLNDDQKSKLPAAAKGKKKGQKKKGGKKKKGQGKGDGQSQGDGQSSDR